MFRENWFWSYGPKCIDFVKIVCVFYGSCKKYIDGKGNPFQFSEIQKFRHRYFGCCCRPSSWKSSLHIWTESGPLPVIIFFWCFGIYLEANIGEYFSKNSMFKKNVFHHFPSFMPKIEAEHQSQFWWKICFFDFLKFGLSDFLHIAQLEDHKGWLGWRFHVDCISGSGLMFLDPKIQVPILVFRFSRVWVVRFSSY